MEPLEPEVGKNVQYLEYETVGPKIAIRAAMITDVHKDTKQVTLIVFRPGDLGSSINHVPYSEMIEPGTWRWV